MKVLMRRYECEFRDCGFTIIDYREYTADKRLNHHYRNSHAHEAYTSEISDNLAFNNLSVDMILKKAKGASSSLGLTSTC